MSDLELHQLLLRLRDKRRTYWCPEQETAANEIERLRNALAAETARVQRLADLNDRLIAVRAGKRAV